MYRNTNEIVNNSGYTGAIVDQTRYVAILFGTITRVDLSELRGQWPNQPEYSSKYSYFE